MSMSVDVISRRAVLRAGIVVVACLSGALVVLAGPAAASPGSAASTAPAPAAPSPSPQPTSGEPPQSNTAGSVTVTFDSRCANYGFDVTNHDTVAHTVILTVGSTQEPPVVIQPGQTQHVALAEDTEPATEVTLTDPAVGTLADVVVRFCIVIANETVTIKANTSYTKVIIGGGPMAPKPRHGTVTRTSTHTGDALRYTPDPCFSGVDKFGYNDVIGATQGVVTVKVLPGACNVTVRRSATDCGARSVTYSATNPYSLPATIQVVAKNAPGGTEEFVVPAHSTKDIRTVHFDVHHADSQIFTFSLVDPVRKLFADQVVFPCPVSSTSSGGLPAIANTGSPVSEQLSVGVAALVVGLSLSIAGTRRRRGGGAN
jgi:hypothetical protein